MMPTYDYTCSKCRHRFEEVQPFSSEPVAVCPECGGKSQRQFTVPVVVYKGTGFYTTDHGRSSNGKSSSTPKDSEPAPAKAEKSEKSEKKEPAKAAASASKDD
jgi:putative FmdB family regulatory protein